MRPWLKLFVALMLLAAPATAQEEAKAPVNKNTEPHVVSPDGCEFQITFPGEPYTSHRCNPENPDECHRIINYTKVYDLDATVNFNVTCNPAPSGMYQRYSGDTMKKTLEAMVGRNNLDEYQSDFSEATDYKYAIIVGMGQTNGNDRIYSAQLWIGQSSVFTVEGEIIGYAGQDADALFADVMASVRANAEPPPAEAQDADKEAEKPEETPAAAPTVPPAEKPAE